MPSSRPISSARMLFAAFRRRSGSSCVRISQLEGKRVALWGWGREGRAAYRALRARDDQPAAVGKRPGFGNGDSEGLAAGELTLFCSPGEAEEVRTLGDARLWVETDATAERLAAFDVVIKSPGISPYRPEAVAARERGTIFIGGTAPRFAKSDDLRVGRA